MAEFMLGKRFRMGLQWNMLKRQIEIHEKRRNILEI